MTQSDIRAYWDARAPGYRTGETWERFGRYMALYEGCCWRHIARVLPKPAGSLILEIGCGSGRWVFRLAPLGYKLVMADLSPAMVAEARDRVAVEGLDQQVTSFYVLDICDMRPLESASFDLVLALGGPMSLCFDPQLAVAECCRLLKPGGTLIFDAANRHRSALDLVGNGETSQLETLLRHGTYNRPDGLTDHRFTPAELARLVGDAGLKLDGLAAAPPFFRYLPGQDEVAPLDDDETYQTLAAVGREYGDREWLLTLSGRLLVVAQRPA